jgi:capsular polysaccharide biosynthesis protein
MRKFKEEDVFSDTVASGECCQVLHGRLEAARKEPRAAPAYIDNPFSENFVKGLSQPHQVSVANDFCVAVADAVLYGERAVVTRGGALLTDVRAIPPQQLNFGPGARGFEFMQPTAEEDGCLVSERVDNPDVVANTQAVLLSSWEHANYGAVLLRQIPKLIRVRSLGLTHLPVVCPASKWQLELLKVFGVTDVIGHDRGKSYAFQSLVVPSQRTSSFFFGSEVASLFEQVAASIQPRHPRIDAPLLYVSRLSQGRKKPRYRRCMNEEDLIDAVSKLGFHIFEPELHSIEEQIATFRSARFVVGPSGAGMFNTVFCRPGIDVLSIEPLPNWIWQHCNLFGSMRHRYGFVTGGAMADDPTPIQKSWRADIATVVARIRQVLREIDAPAGELMS